MGAARRELRRAKGGVALVQRARERQVVLKQVGDVDIEAGERHLVHRVRLRLRREHRPHPFEQPQAPPHRAAHVGTAHVVHFKLRGIGERL